MVSEDLSALYMALRASAPAADDTATSGRPQASSQSEHARPVQKNPSADLA
jgi:hypothetical protein